MSPLKSILATYRQTSKTEREKGTYFEELIRTYFRYAATYADKTKVIYNPQITIRDIPLEAYDYIVNGKPALEWVMERQSVTTDKDSGITNDANLWATETLDKKH